MSETEVDDGVGMTLFRCSAAVSMWYALSQESSTIFKENETNIEPQPGPILALPAPPQLQHQLLLSAPPLQTPPPPPPPSLPTPANSAKLPSPPHYISLQQLVQQKQLKLVDSASRRRRRQKMLYTTTLVVGKLKAVASNRSSVKAKEL